MDDTGGGDGVEFYLTLSNGEEWGWQAKFYHPNGRLGESNRKASIKNSLNTALKNHKNLKRWFLCTPSDFTPDEVKWLSNLQSQTKNIQRDVSIEHWGDTEFNSQLSKPLFLGIRNYFFGELELSGEWFKAQVNKQIENIGNKFIPALHVETAPDRSIQCFLNEAEYRNSLEARANELRKYFADFSVTVETLRTQEDRLAQWIETRQKLLFYANSMISIFMEVNKIFDELKGCLTENRLENVSKNSLLSIEAELSKNNVVYSETLKNLKRQVENSSVKLTHDIEQAINTPLNLSKEVEAIVRETRLSLDKLVENQLTIIGDASIGKTHIACWTCFKKTKMGQPAILLLGKHFHTEASLEKQILERLDIPQGYSWNDFVQSLATAAHIYKVKIPIVIDALDEALKMDIWRNDLAGLVSSVSNQPNLGIITTCRSSYKSEIWQSTEAPNVIEAYGFGSDSIEAAIEKYFEFYKIKADMSFIPFEQFAFPIFLRIFCEISNHERKTTHEVFLGEQTMLGIFDSYVKQRNDIISASLSRHKSASVVEDALKRLGNEIWHRKARYIPLEDVVTIIDNKSLSDLDWPHSLTFALLNEGLIINRDLFDKKEVVFFAYNLLGGFLIAKGLIDDKTIEQIQAFIDSNEFQTLLLSDDFSKLHPLSEDILKFFSLLLPTIKHKHLFECSRNNKAFSSSVEAIFELSPELIDLSAVNLIAHLFENKDNRKPLLQLSIKTMRHLRHPLNIDFWEKHLTSLSMPERDLCWTEVIRQNSSVFLKEIPQFETKCKQQILTAADEQILALSARYYRWMLASTVRDLRDAATQALYWYGRRFPKIFFDLMENSLALNDPYIPERMLAAGYGVSMALESELLQNSFLEINLTSECQKLYDLMFKENAHYATTHILSRDYALGIIKIALNFAPNVLTPDQKLRISEPFVDGGIRRWGESDEKGKENYREGSMPVHMDFENYTLGRLVPERGNYDFDNPDYRKLHANFFWRLYDLGYSHNAFAQIDREIHWGNWAVERSAGAGKVDRYGKKYSWIAFFELAGYRKDNNLLPERRMDFGRIPDVDIDPSFPRTPAVKVVETDYLGDRSIPVGKWIVDSQEIDFSAYLECELLAGENGDWVLLDGFVNQEDLAAKRARFIFSRGLLIKKDETQQITRYLTRCDPHGIIPDIPADYYTFAGEIPLSKEFQFNGFSEISFLGKKIKKKQAVKKVARLPDGSLISETELLPILLKDFAKTEVTTETKIEDHLAALQIEMIDEILVEEEVEVQERVNYQVLVPVRSYRWEGNHSTVNKVDATDVPSKELAVFLDLRSRPQTFNLYEKDGKLASLSFSYSDNSSGNRQNLTYLRKDLLTKYLNEYNYDLVWIIWGEREFRAEGVDGIDEVRAYAQKHPAYMTFKNIKIYNSTKQTIAFLVF